VIDAGLELPAINQCPYNLYRSTSQARRVFTSWPRPCMPAAVTSPPPCAGRPARALPQHGIVFRLQVRAGAARRDADPCVMPHPGPAAGAAHWASRTGTSTLRGTGLSPTPLSDPRPVAVAKAHGISPAQARSMMARGLHPPHHPLALRCQCVQALLAMAVGRSKATPNPRTVRRVLPALLVPPVPRPCSLCPSPAAAASTPRTWSDTCARHHRRAADAL